MIPLLPLVRRQLIASIILSITSLALLWLSANAFARGQLTLLVSLVQLAGVAISILLLAFPFHVGWSAVKKFGATILEASTAGIVYGIFSGAVNGFISFAAFSTILAQAISFLAQKADLASLFFFGFLQSIALGFLLSLIAAVAAKKLG